MSDVTRLLRRPGDPEGGASAVEYGLLVAAIAAAIVIIVFALGGMIKTTLYDKTCANINGSGGPPQDC